MELSPSKPSRIGVYWPFLKWFLFAIVLYFVGQRAFQIWKDAPPLSVKFNGLWLIPSALAYFVGWLPSVWFWRKLLHELRQPVGLWNAFRAYYVGHVGKYIPGKALVLVIRGTMVQEPNANLVAPALMAGYETLVFMATGFAISVGFAPMAYGSTIGRWIPTQFAWFRDQPVVWLVSVAILTFATTPISAWLFSGISRKMLRYQTTDAKTTPAISAYVVCQGIFATSLGWVCHALSLSFVVQSVSDQPFDLAQFPVWLTACSFSTVGGFVVLLAPGGLGIREGLLIEALKNQPATAAGTAVIVAGLLRAVWFATEITTAACLFLLRKSGDPIKS